jgi:hypothetical protein
MWLKQVDSHIQASENEAMEELPWIPGLSCSQCLGLTTTSPGSCACCFHFMGKETEAQRSKCQCQDRKPSSLSPEPRHSRPLLPCWLINSRLWETPTNLFIGCSPSPEPWFPVSPRKTGTNFSGLGHPSGFNTYLDIYLRNVNFWKIRFSLPHHTEACFTYRSWKNKTAYYFEAGLQE